MGIFTYHQAKKTRQEVGKLRNQQRDQAAAQSIEQRSLAQQARETELFQKLPPEGKEEFRAAKALCREKYASFGAWKRAGNGKDVRAVFNELASTKAAIFRKHDLIP